jgi:hypothetical protein
MKAWNANQYAAAQRNAAVKKQNYEKAVRAQVMGREALPPMTREEALITKELMRQKMYGPEDENEDCGQGNQNRGVDYGGHTSDFQINEEVPGQSYSAGVHSSGDFNNLRPTNPSYAQIDTDASGSAAITDWPKRVPTQFWNQPVQPPANVQLPQSAYKAAMGLGDYYDEVSDGLLDSQVQFAAEQLAQTTPRPPLMGAAPSNEISPLTQGPAQLMTTMFPGNITLPVLGSVPQVNIVYAGVALFALGVLSRLRNG